MSKCPHLDEPRFIALVDKMVERYEQKRAAGEDRIEMRLQAGAGEAYSSWPAMYLEEILTAKGYRVNVRSWTGAGFTSEIEVETE
ncbi:hypothetical protein SAMN05444390_1011651 [Marinobacterium lutimaris]|uniref:Uncharacterized protein n=1 Tax=Marinobacterium lutimaris TaxID=568106 RepID=A0A1H5Y885_9GAMM|nr:hypothetical protein SAMN05444390_1011651 [Marinobacterium lutimaris]